MGDQTRIRSGELAAIIAHHGAELIGLTDKYGRELMSDGNPAYWRGRAPLLFPIVGRLHMDTLRIDGREYSMQKHGFARKSDFELIDASESAALFRLSDSPESRAQYPFAFELDAQFRLNGATLHKTVTIRNSGDGELPFSFGYHPAFAWPLPFGGDRDAHLIRFERDEPSSLARVTPYGTIGADPVPTPVTDNSLMLHDGLFTDDALVWRDLNSQQLSYGVPGLPCLDIVFPDTNRLGIWTKPNAAFICVEPWAGIADPEGFDGEFRDKPGVMGLAPGGERSFRMDITLTA